MAATQERRLSEFPTAANILLTTLLFGSVVDTTSTSGYDSVKILASDLANAILGDFAYTQDLQTNNKTIFGAINELRVLSGSATPDNAIGTNNQLYIKYNASDYSVVGLYVKLNNAWREISTGGGGGNTDYIECTQAEYDAMEQAGTLDPTVMYFITDGQSGGGATELADLTDVDLTSPADGQLLRYNGTSGKWENAGIINDTTASASSVYSSNKTNTLLSNKADKGVSNSVSGTLDVAMNQNAFITYRTAQNILIVSAVFNANSAVANNTTIAHISGVSQIGQTFVSSNGDKGTAGRFKMQNGNIINEFAMPSGEYFSLTFVSFI